MTTVEDIIHGNGHHSEVVVCEHEDQIYVFTAPWINCPTWSHEVLRHGFFMWVGKSRENMNSFKSIPVLPEWVDVSLFKTRFPPLLPYDFSEDEISRAEKILSELT